MLVAIGSVKGSPGVTTFAVALAASWPASRRVVVEADASGGDLAARFGLRPSPGLVSLAAEIRTAALPDGEVVWRHAQMIGDGLWVVPAPPGAAESAAALGAMTPGGLAAMQVSAADPEALVVVDVGRMDPTRSTVGMADGADVLLVLAGAHADDLAHLPSRLKALGRGCRQRRLLLVGEGYPTNEVERELGAAIAARIPHDARAAAALRGLGSGRRRTQLGRAATRCARTLIAHAPTGPANPRNVATPATVPSARWTPVPVSWPANGQAAPASNNGSNGEAASRTEGTV